MTRLNTAISITLLALITLSSVAHSRDIVEELRVCAENTEEGARLACFDKLTERAVREGSAEANLTHEGASKPGAETATAAKSQPLPEELGKSKKIQYVGSITSCKKGRHGNWYFIFDNGQVWKEVNNRNHRFDECNFNATITRDAFGYKMRIDGVKRAIRVRRNR